VWEEIQVAGTQTADENLKEKESHAILQAALTGYLPKAAGL
jgi:hypothetical protein